MEFDLTVTVSVILAVCAIISPVITTVINNRHQLRMKKLELKQSAYENEYLHKRELFETYLMTAGKYLAVHSPAHSSAYQESLQRILLFVPPETRELIDEADTELNGHTMVAGSYLYRVAVRLGELLREE